MTAAARPSHETTTTSGTGDDTVSEPQLYYQIYDDTGALRFQSDDRDTVCDWLRITQDCDDYRVAAGTDFGNSLHAPYFMNIVKGPNWYAVWTPKAEPVDVLALARQSVIDLYAAFPTITLDIPTARKQFNEESGELQEAATELKAGLHHIRAETDGIKASAMMHYGEPYMREIVAAELADVIYTAMGLAEACHISPDELSAAVAEKCRHNDLKRPENGYVALNSKIQKASAT